jgi:hypothetical protein
MSSTTFTSPPAKPWRIAAGVALIGCAALAGWGWIDAATPACDPVRLPPRPPAAAARLPAPDEALAARIQRGLSGTLGQRVAAVRAPQECHDVDRGLGAAASLGASGQALALLQPKSGSYPVADSLGGGLGGPMAGAIRSLM